VNLRNSASKVLGSRLGQNAKEPVRKLFEACGYDLVPLDTGTGPLLQTLLRDSRVATLVDVGANQGQYARRMRLLGFTGNMISFEPGREAFRLLQRNAAADPLWRAEQLAVGRTTGTTVLNVSANSVSSSLLSVEKLHVDSAPESRIKGTEQVHMKTLDSALQSQELGPAWVKIDTQGYELEVLGGAARTLQQAVVVQAELSLAPLYQDQPQFLTVLELLVSRGFSTFDLIPGFRSASDYRLLQCDVIAVRRN